MAMLAKGTLRRKLAELELALEGKVEEHHRYVLEMQLSRLEELDEHVALFKEAGLDGLPSSFVERQLIQGAREDELRIAIEQARKGSAGMGSGWMFGLLGVVFAGLCALSLRPPPEYDAEERS